MENINCMSSWSQIEQRLNLQNIGEFLRTGGDITEIDRRGFTERKESAYKEMQEYLAKTCDKEKLADIMNKVAVYVGTREDIFFSLGMKTGAQLAIQLTTNLESDF